MSEDERPIEERIEFMMRLQCKLIDDVRREIEKLRKTWKGEKQPMATMDEDVRRLFKREIPKPEIPLDDRL